jgi:multimeric flavodoxin WrbA
MEPFILGIRGSPRLDGNSDLLLTEVQLGAQAEGARWVQVRPADRIIAGCRGCDGCRETGECRVADDMQQVYPLLDQAAAIVIATPVFFCGLPGPLKCLVDRAQARWRGRRLRKPTREQRRQTGSGPGFLIAVGGSGRPDVFTGVELTVREFLLALDRPYGGGLTFAGVEEPGAIAEQRQALEQAQELGRRVAREAAPGLDPARNPK